jgi:hypothetical protein
MKHVVRALILLSIVTCFSCQEDKSQPARDFYMGFTPFPYDISLEAVEETYANITSNGDIINHHFDNGVPWVEALAGEPFSTDVINDWNFRKENTPTSFKVYLSVAAINPNRNGLAFYRGETPDMALPSPWDTYSFNSTEVKTAYVNYCKRIIDFFQPEYFNMSVEANLLHFVNPSLWQDYIQFHQYVYTTLKSAYPELPVFCSITGAHLLEGYFDGNDASLQKLAALQLLEYSDMYALSFYPFMSKYLGNPYPKDSFKELFSISAKPLAVAETGYPAQTFTMTINNVSSTISSDEKKQELYIQDLLEACNERKAEFVINFVIKDYDELWKDLGAREDLIIAWRDTGFIDEQGHQRSAYQIWKDYLGRPRQ